MPSKYATLNNWIRHEAIPFSIDSSEKFNAAVDKMISSFNDSVELLGLGEALHGGEEILILRNQLFQRLVEKHGYSAIAIESSFPRARIVNEYVNGRDPESYETIQTTGFSHGFGLLEANRELVEWMRRYNSDPAHRVKIQFYGFDSPTEMTGSDSPRQVLHFVLDYLALIDGDDKKRHKRIDSLLGADSDWVNPAALMDPTKSVGLSDAAISLRIETEDLITELEIRRPELVGKSSEKEYVEALQYASIARQLLNYHAAMARKSENRVAELLGIRDAMMAANLAYIVSGERGRGKVLAFAHNRHLQRGKAQWQLGQDIHLWWPAGSHLNEMFGSHYAVIGSGLGVSEDNGIDQPDPNTLEAMFTGLPEPALFIPTCKGQGLSAAEIASLPTRSVSIKNTSYFPLSSKSFTDFDWLVILHSTTYSRGGPPLQYQKEEETEK